MKSFTVIIVLLVVLIVVAGLVYLSLGARVSVRDGSGTLPVPGDATVFQVFNSLTSSLGVPGGTVPGEILRSSQIAAAFSNAETSINGTISVSLSGYSYLNESRDLSMNVTSVSLRAVVNPMATGKSEIVLNSQLSGVVLSAYGIEARLGSAQLSADVVVDEGVDNVSGSALYGLVLSLKPSDASGDIAISMSDLTYQTPSGSSTLSAPSVYCQFNLTQVPGASSIDLSLQFADLRLPGSYPGTLSVLQVTGKASVNESSGTLAYSYSASTTLQSIIHGFL